MIDRRDLLRGAALGVAIASTSALTACEYAESVTADTSWKLINFFRTGDMSQIDGLVVDDTTLLSFSSSMISGYDDLIYSGREKVKKGLIGFREMLIDKGSDDQRIFINAKVLGKNEQGVEGLIELHFSAPGMTSNGCGDYYSEYKANLYFVTEVIDYEVEPNVWALKNMAIMPLVVNSDA